MELNEQENQKYIYVFMDKHKSENIYLYVIWTKPEFSSWNENIKTSKFLTQAGNTGLQTVQSIILIWGYLTFTVSGQN